LKKHGCLTEERLAKVHQVRIEGDVVTSWTVNKGLAAMANFGMRLPSRAPKLLGTVHQISQINSLHPKCGTIESHLPHAFELAFGKKRLVQASGQFDHAL
jgi:hypothetical protein